MSFIARIFLLCKEDEEELEKKRTENELKEERALIL
tara:strand:- start:365 stop:472 length:108 start_codon:yes stop_codon:yes gene_type:complete